MEAHQSSQGTKYRLGGPPLGWATRAPKTFKNLAGYLRFRAGVGPEPRPNQALNTRHGFRAMLSRLRRVSTTIRQLLNCEIAHPSIGLEAHRSTQTPSTLMAHQRTTKPHKTFKSVWWPSDRRVVGEGPDGNLLSKIGDLGPVPARIRGVMYC